MFLCAIFEAFTEICYSLCFISRHLFKTKQVLTEASFHIKRISHAKHNRQYGLCLSPARVLKEICVLCLAGYRESTAAGFAVGFTKGKETTLNACKQLLGKS